MHRFTLIKGNKTYTLDIDYIKILFGDNYNEKMNIYYILRNFYNKVSNSSYSIETSNKYLVKFDDNNIDLKQWMFIDINPYFDIENDLKLGTKSLITKYLNCFNDDIEKNDLFNTLSILINSLNLEFFEPESDILFGDKKLELRLGEISRPTIFKEITAYFTDNDIDCNSSDFTYEDIILLQLALLKGIAKKNKLYKLLAICNIPFLTDRIKNYILEMKYENCFCIINTNGSIDVNIRNFCIISNKHYLDLANDEMILDKIMDMPFHCDKDELINKIEKNIFSSEIDKNDPLSIELFSFKI